ncbi:hypothetical protein MRX96_035248 [Rhipicephalus microplus]|uniref:Platelet-derived growth factor (PDGF) family profile domain-containing protein n=1 Tax=Rhipicephalus microplus TaxID=6941 RepID=A0A9J6DAF9_RHIMP|nr:snake venom vascular endothelial growth factor toxin cratrin-like [Rhipicephalus microplus]KAH8018838.1 hypothetical protein HPB51_012792 [Rhipicephalus microplus]
MTSEHDRVARGVAWTAMLVLFTCFAVGLCGPRRYVNRETQRYLEHREMVQREGRCKFPRRRTICVQDKYPNESKRYEPHCTVVHRCQPDMACCNSEDKHCQPKSIQMVERTFAVVQIDATGEQRKFETLTFENHTECECRSKYDPIR